MKNRKIYWGMFYAIVMLLTVFFTGMTLLTIRERRIIEEQRVIEEQKEEQNWQAYMWERLSYSRSMNFRGRIIVDGEQFNLGMARYQVSMRNRHYTEFVFVHTAAEAEAFPNNVIVAWPSENELLHRIEIDVMHREASRTAEELEQRWWLRRREVTLEEFGLSYPITVEDFVDNWEGIRDLREALRRW